MTIPNQITTLLLILLSATTTAQISSFITTTTHDTIPVDKITATDFEIKTKTAGKKKTYSMDDITSYYIFEQHQHYQRITLDQKAPKPVNRYDYKRNDDKYLEDYKARIKYKYIQRLTHGKVKLFAETSTAYASQHNASGAPNAPAIAHKNKIFYIAIDNAKLELLSDEGELKLTKKVYDLLKMYLHGNDQIARELDLLYASKPVADKEKIIDVIHSYNKHVAAEK